MTACRPLMAFSIAAIWLSTSGPVNAADFSDRMVVTRTITDPAVPDELFDMSLSEGSEEPLTFRFSSVLTPIGQEQSFLRTVLPAGYSINIFLLEGVGQPSDLVRVEYSGLGRIDIDVAFYSDPFPFSTSGADKTYSVLEVAGALDGACPACVDITPLVFPFYTTYNNAHRDAPILYPFNIQVGSDVEPIPEPEIWATMLLGLLGIGSSRARHRRVNRN